MCAAWLALAAACAPGPPPEPPSPVSVDEPPPAEEPATAEPAARLTEPVRPVPPPPWLPPAVRLAPAAPGEGTALAVHIADPPGGRRAVAVEGELAGAPVRFAPTPGGWFGLAALPIGSAGPQVLSLAFRVGPDSTAHTFHPVEVAGRTYPATRLRVAPRYSDPPASTLARIREERERIRAALETVSPAWLPRGPFTWPRPPRVTSPFGQRRVFNGELRSRHWGLDLGGGTGDPVLAAAAGRVALTGEFYYQGGAVYVDHGLGVYTGYFHLSRIDVEAGAEVEAGQLLGGVGATGRVTGPHLHWSLYVAGQNLDPASLLELELPRAAAMRGAAGSGESATGSEAE